MDRAWLRVVDLGRMGYAEAYARQVASVEGVLSARARVGAGGAGLGDLLLVEHDPVITVSRRASAAGHVLMSEDGLRARGIAVHATDRGGDVTYHGPGQLVAYPIVDLERLGLGIHGYVRALERAIVGVLARFGVEGWRDPGATGVWVGERWGEDEGRVGGGGAKIAAIGVRVRKWVTMHGLAINVDPDMSHYGCIVPCGLAGRAVTSLRMELGAGCPEVTAVKAALPDELERALWDAPERRVREP